METIDREKFFNEYRNVFGPLKQSQVDGISSILNCLEGDEAVSKVEWAAYMFATVKHETAGTYQPIEEYGKGKGRKYGIRSANGKTYYGRGYVQLTWEANYSTMGKYVKQDLVAHPEKALDPSVAYSIMSIGMRKGLFTGKKLGDYIKEGVTDYKNARRIINGMDCAELIAKYATKFEGILKASI